MPPKRRRIVIEDDEPAFPVEAEPGVVERVIANRRARIVALERHESRRDRDLERSLDDEQDRVHAGETEGLLAPEPVEPDAAPVSDSEQKSGSSSGSGDDSDSAAGSAGDDSDDDAVSALDASLEDARTQEDAARQRVLDGWAEFWKTYSKARERVSERELLRCVLLMQTARGPKQRAALSLAHAIPRTLVTRAAALGDLVKELNAAGSVHAGKISQLNQLTTQALR